MQYHASRLEPICWRSTPRSAIALGGCRLAIHALAMGAVVPAAIVLAGRRRIARGASSAVASIMSAGASRWRGSLTWRPAVRRLKPQLTLHPWTGAALAVAEFVAAWAPGGSPDTFSPRDRSAPAGEEQSPRPHTALSSAQGGSLCCG